MIEANTLTTTLVQSKHRVSNLAY